MNGNVIRRITFLNNQWGGIMTLLNTTEIMALIPNRYPIIYIDTVESLVPGEEVVAIKNVTINEQFMLGYRPDSPQMPNTLMIEALAQTASILILKSPEFFGKTAYLGAAKNVLFHQTVRPGDQIVFTVKLTKKKENMGVVQTNATVNGQMVCEADLTFVVAPRDDLLGKK